MSLANPRLATNSRTRVCVVVKPNARENAVLEEKDGVLVVALHAPPEKGKANKELVKFLSRRLKKQVRIVSGFGSRTKHVEILP